MIIKSTSRGIRRICAEHRGERSVACNTITLDPRTGHRVAYTYRKARRNGLTADQAHDVVWNLVYDLTLSSVEAVFRTAEGVVV